MRGSTEYWVSAERSSQQPCSWLSTERAALDYIVELASVTKRPTSLYRRLGPTEFQFIAMADQDGLVPGEAA